MDIFDSEEKILGTLDLPALQQASRDFYDTALLIRRKLGRKAYILDRYLYDLIHTMSLQITYDLGSQGLDNASRELHCLIRQIISDDEAALAHPFYEEAEAFIRSHPLEYQESATRNEIYFCKLMDGFMRHAIRAFYDSNIKDMHGQLDIIQHREYFQQIGELIGDPALIEQFNAAFAARFYPVTALQVFVAGLNDALHFTLTERDHETSRTVIQLVLDEMEIERKKEEDFSCN